jgi:predicted metal-dependent hydrolase
VQGVPRVPEDAVFTPPEALTAAQEFLDRGQAFHAHEVFEAMWKQAEPADRELWQGLAQLAVAITHVQRGNHKGALALLQRAASAIDQPGAPHGIDTAGLVGYADNLTEELQAGAEIRPDQLRPSVRR